MSYANKQLEKILNRKLARLLSHLDQNHALTPTIESSIKRCFRFLAEDITGELGLRTDKENNHGSRNREK